MMENVLARGQRIARDAELRMVRDDAQQLRAMFGSAAVEVEEARVLVRGRGIIKRWLIDPSLRFLAGGLK
jgi:hypothetical protein